MHRCRWRARQCKDEDTAWEKHPSIILICKLKWKFHFMFSQSTNIPHNSRRPIQGEVVWWVAKVHQQLNEGPFKRRDAMPSFHFVHSILCPISSSTITTTTASTGRLVLLVPHNSNQSCISRILQKVLTTRARFSGRLPNKTNQAPFNNARITLH